MATLHSVRAHHFHLHLNERAARDLRRLAVVAVAAAAVLALVARWPGLVPRATTWVSGVPQSVVFLGVVVLTVAAIGLAARAVVDYQDHHEEHDVR